MRDGQFVEQRAAVVLDDLDASYYPDSDGQPMAVNDEHYQAIQSIRQPLEMRYRDSPDTYITGDLLMYYVPGDRSRCVAPDVMVVHGVARGPRKTYLVWREGRPPDFVAEVSSPGSRKQDRTKKRELYASLGIREYFLFDPVYEDSEQEGRLQGYRLWGGGSVEVGPGGELGSRKELRSEVLGVSLRPEGKRVRLRDLATGVDLLNVDETEKARRAESARRRTAEEAKRAAEEAKRVEAARRRRAEEAKRAEAARRRAAEQERDQQAAACRAAEARVAELQALLETASARDSKKTPRD